MPIHLKERNMTSEIEGSRSAVIVACNMCAGASLAMQEKEPFLQLFKHFLVSPPLKRYVEKLQTQLEGKDMRTVWFKGGIIQQFFLCLWTARQRKKFRSFAQGYETVIVLGCDSAVKTVQDALNGTNCKVVHGTDVAGIMNTQLKFCLPCDISFESCRVVSLCQ